MESQILSSLNHLLLSLIILLISNNVIETTMAATSSTQTLYRTYVKSACNSTVYPQVCYKSLSSYASKIKSNPQKLCSTALTLALKGSRSCSKTVTKLATKKLSHHDAEIVMDCVENMRDSIDELKQSLNALGHLNDSSHTVEDIKTWVSAALTDDSTCTDEFDEQTVSSKVKKKIQNCILVVARLTSNALSLINDNIY